MTPQDAELAALSEGALMALFANGDPGAAKELTARLLPRVLRHAQRVLGNRAEAEDVAQEAMLRLWTIAKDWNAQGGAKPATWIYRVTANLCVDRLRRSGRAVGLDQIDNPPDDRPNAEMHLQVGARMTALDTALAALPERQRQAVVLRHIEELSNPEIAEILHVSVEAVESLTARGRRALAASLGARKEALGYD